MFLRMIWRRSDKCVILLSSTCCWTLLSPLSTRQHILNPGLVKTLLIKIPILCVRVCYSTKNTPWTHLHLLSTEDGRRLCWNMLERAALLHKQQLHKTGVVKAFQIHSLTSFIINWVIVCYQPHAELHSDSLYFLFHGRLYESTITGLTGLMAEQYNKKNLWALRLFNCSAEWKLTGAVDHKQGKYVDGGGRLNQQVQQQRFIAVRTKAFSLITLAIASFPETGRVCSRETT